MSRTREEQRARPAELTSSPKNHDLLALVKGARNGLVYGCKVRKSTRPVILLEILAPRIH